MAALMATMTEFKREHPGPFYNAIVTKPEFIETLRAQLPKSLSSVPFLSIQLYAKANQVVDAWAFSDDRLLRRYLDGQVDELELLAMIGSSVKPFQ